MESNAKKLFRVVVDYVQNLVPAYKDTKFNIQQSTTPEMDAQALFRLLNGHTFCEYARNGKQYLYCFVFDAKDLKTAEYILRSNGIKPRLHLSRYYNTPDLAFRVPVLDIENNVKAHKFKESLMGLRTGFNMDKNAILHLDQIKQKVN